MAKIGIIGKGALGLLYASVATRTLGDDAAVFVMDEERYQRHLDDVYTVNGEPMSFATIPVSQAEPVDLVLVAVKAPGLDAALKLIEPLLGPDTPVISLMNGLSSEGRIAERVGAWRVAGCVSYGMDATRFGGTLTYTHEGWLQLGALPEPGEGVVERVAAILGECGIANEVCDDIVYRLWTKWMINTGVNQACAAHGVCYRELLADETALPFRTYVASLREAKTVANAEGIPLTEADLNSYIEMIRTFDPESRPSMAQDVLNHNPCEVDEFAGLLVELAAKHGLYTPTNAWLLKTIKAIEAEY